MLSALSEGTGNGVSLRWLSWSLLFLPDWLSSLSGLFVTGFYCIQNHSIHSSSLRTKQFRNRNVYWPWAKISWQKDLRACPERATESTGTSTENGDGVPSPLERKRMVVKMKNRLISVSVWLVSSAEWVTSADHHTRYSRNHGDDEAPREMERWVRCCNVLISGWVVGHRHHLHRRNGGGARVACRRYLRHRLSQTSS